MTWNTSNDLAHRDVDLVAERKKQRAKTLEQPWILALDVFAVGSHRLVSL